MQIFYTINPHINNLSMNRLQNDFRYILQKYYRKTLGPRYYKKKEQQFKIAIFPEVGDREVKEPHLHMIIEMPMKAVNQFRNFIREGVKKIYPSLTDKLEDVNGEAIELWKYCLKEDLGILTKGDLFEKKTI